MKKNAVCCSYITVIISIILNLMGCSHKKSVTVIGDVAYDVTREETCVYIREEGVYVPFVVVSSQYTEGNTLLLRKEIIADRHRTNDYSSYYENSEIDVFLNSEYYARLDDIESYINRTDISITDDTALGWGSADIKVIERDVFLLSCKELDFGSNVVAGEEGKALHYFSVVENRLAYEGEETVGWILRTPNTSFLSLVYVMRADGVLDMTNAFDYVGIRPAFCVKSQTPILKRKDVVYGKEVYVLD